MHASAICYFPSALAAKFEAMSGIAMYNSRRKNWTLLVSI